MTDPLLVAAAVIAGAWLLTVIDRRDRRITWLETELAAAETDLRAAGGSRRCHLRQATRRPAPMNPPRFTDDDIARLACPVFDPPREDRYLVRRRIREAA